MLWREREHGGKEYIIKHEFGKDVLKRKILDAKCHFGSAVPIEHLEVLCAAFRA